MNESFVGRVFLAITSVGAIGAAAIVHVAYSGRYVNLVVWLNILGFVLFAALLFAPSR